MTTDSKDALILGDISDLSESTQAWLDEQPSEDPDQVCAVCARRQDRGCRRGPGAGTSPGSRLAAREDLAAVAGSAAMSRRR